jgi:hypothetical protein
VGTDIRYFAETKTPEGWKLANIHHGDNAPFYFGENRNYELFTILAGVQRQGFREKLEPIDAPRGLPPDVSAPVLGYAKRWEPYAYDHSWLTLRELRDFPWHEKKLWLRAYVDRENFRRFCETGMPERFACRPPATTACGRACEVRFPPSGWRIVSAQDMTALLDFSEEEIASLMECDPAQLRTQIKFGVPYSRFCPALFSDTLPKLDALGPPDEVRVVFWFDS